MATPAPGTIPALPPYQPGALAITGQELLEIASSTNATTATSGYMLLVDVVGKAPSAMPTQTPSLSDLIACFSVSGGQGYNVALGNLVAQLTGNLPIGGATGQILSKASGANFAAAWVNLSAQVTASTGISVGGSTTVAIALASAAGLSVLGVTGAAQADPAPIVGTAGQVLAVNAGGTGLAFRAATTIVPGPFQTGTLTQFGVVYGNGTSPLGATAAGTTTWALLGNGTALAPSFQQINLGSATITGILPGGNYSAVNLAASGAGGVQGILPGANMSAVNLATTGAGGIQNTLGVPHGGTGTTSLTGNAVLLGAGTATLQFAAATTPGAILISQGSTSNPVFEVVGTDLTMGAAGAATVVGLQGRALLSTAPATAQVVSWNGLAWAPAITVTNVSTGWGLAGGAITTSGTLSIATTNPPYGFDMPVNLSLTASTAAGVLTISFVGNNGVAPSATNPILVPFRDVTLGNGDPVWRPITAALSMSTFTTGATLGAGNGVPFRFYIALFDTGGTPMPALINCSSATTGGASIYPLNEFTLQSSTQIGSTATGLGTFYTPNGTSVAARPFRIVGVLDYAGGLATAGTYTSTPTTLSLFGPGSKKPGDVVQVQQLFTTTIASTNLTTFAPTFLANAITPTSAPNLVKVTAGGSLANTTGGNANNRVQLVRGSTAQIGPILGAFTDSAAFPNSVMIQWIDGPATAASTTYTLQLSSGGGTTSFPSATGTTSGATMLLEEIQG